MTSAKTIPVMDRVRRLELEQHFYPITLPCGCVFLGSDRAEICETCHTREITPPTPALMYCPYCGTRHLDVGEWKTRPHHKHLCLNPNCNKLFRFEGAAGEYFYGAKFE